MRLGWLSDIHLNFLDESALQRFLWELASCDVDAWLLGGDIGESDSVLQFLQMMEIALPCKTYFILGNHDFYGGSLVDVRTRVGHSMERSERLIWLTQSEPQMLDGDIAVVGDDSWADARFGNAHSTPVELNDFFLIEELSRLSRARLIHTLNRLGDEAATRLAPKLERAAAACSRVIVLTHVPPFREAAWHQGRPSGDDWVPWFSCRAVGEAIMRCASAHPQTSFLVLCGHTHGSGVSSPSANIIVYTAEAVYGIPCVQRVFEVDGSTALGTWLDSDRPGFCTRG